MTAVRAASAPWVRWLGLFPPFSTTLVPIQAAAGLLDPVYAAANIVVAVLVVSACAWGGSVVYRGGASSAERRGPEQRRKDGHTGWLAFIGTGLVGLFEVD